MCNFIGRTEDSAVCAFVMKSKYYRHFKGNYYKYLTEAKGTEDLQDYVIYKALYGEGKVWARPKDMFFDNVSKEGYEGPRFLNVTWLDYFLSKFKKH